MIRPRSPPPLRPTAIWKPRLQNKVPSFSCSALQRPLLTELVKKGCVQGPDVGREFGAMRQCTDQCHRWSGAGVGTAVSSSSVQTRSLAYEGLALSPEETH